VWDPKRERVLRVGQDGSTATWDGARWQTEPACPLGVIRQDFSLTVHEQTGEVVLFGGRAAPERTSTAFDATFIWNGSGWRSAGAGAAPPARSEHTVAWDEPRRALVLFGGAGATGTLADTWLWDGAQWSPFKGSAQPKGRILHSFVRDPERNTLLLFGGLDQGNALADTWLWNQNGWVEHKGAVTPSARLGHRVAWDPLRKILTLVGGGAVRADGVEVLTQDTWSWSGTQWSMLTPPSGPSASSRGSIFWDPESARLLLFGGFGSVTNAGPVRQNETWAWDGTLWAQVAGPATLTPRYGHQVEWDPERKNLVSFGGNAVAKGSAIELAETWQLNGSIWRQRPSPTSPGARASHEMRWDPERKEIVLFGGGGTTTPPYSDTWLWNGASWRSPATSVKPTGRTRHAMIWDPTRKSIMIFGGYLSETTVLGDTWLWNGSTWKRADGPSPGARSNESIVWDQTRNHAILFGGDGAIRENTETFGETWRWSAAGWEQLTPATSPSPRGRHAMIWDPERQQIVLFGGSAASRKISEGIQIFSDTWLWNGTDWINATGELRPPARDGTRLSWDPVRKVVVMFGGNTGSTELSDTWAWDGQAWREIAAAASIGPPRLTQHSLNWDPIHKRHILIGGSNAKLYYGDTWLLYLRGGGCSSGSECGSGFCTDGVCCETPVCGACQTCAGLSPGVCTPVSSAEDPDTCAEKDLKSCNRAGRCGLGLGATCTVESECAVGICTAGICSKGATCKNASTVIDRVGKEVSCGIYACQNGACRNTCDSVSDCSAPYECVTNACIAPSFKQAPEGGCATHADTPEISRIFGFACAVLGLALRRRALKPRSTKA
jgi:hypothetical protein